MSIDSCVSASPDIYTKILPFIQRKSIFLITFAYIVLFSAFILKCITETLSVAKLV
jgi:hypothetical protein